MIPRKHASHHSPSSESKTPVWMIVGLVLVALMGLTYAQSNVSHHVNEILWSEIISPLSNGASELLGAVNNASGSAAGKTSGVNADALDGLDSTAFLSGGSGGAQYNEDSVHVSGSLGDFPLAVQGGASPAALGQSGDYVPFQTDSSGRLFVNPGTITVNTTTDGEYYERSCGYLTGGTFSTSGTGTIVSPSNIPNQCVTPSGTIPIPPCNIGDTSLGVDCHPNDFELYDGEFFFVEVGECVRTCKSP